MALIRLRIRRSSTPAPLTERDAPDWTYGLPELVGEAAIRGSTRGQQPRLLPPPGFLLLVAPLVAAGVLCHATPGLSVHAVSGYSGGGKALIERFEGDLTLVWRGYAYGATHKHLAEMRVHAGLSARPPVLAGRDPRLPRHDGRGAR